MCEVVCCMEVCSSHSVETLKYMLYLTFVVVVPIHTPDKENWILPELWTPNHKLAPQERTSWHLMMTLRIGLLTIQLTVGRGRIHLFITESQWQIPTSLQSGQNFWVVTWWMMTTRPLHVVAQFQIVEMKILFQSQAALPLPFYSHLWSVCCFCHYAYYNHSSGNFSEEYLHHSMTWCVELIPSKRLTQLCLHASHCLIVSLVSALVASWLGLFAIANGPAARPWLSPVLMEPNDAWVVWLSLLPWLLSVVYYLQCRHMRYGTFSGNSVLPYVKFISFVSGPCISILAWCHWSVVCQFELFLICPISHTGRCGFYR